jgi:hypothetical protein
MEEEISNIPSELYSRSCPSSRFFGIALSCVSPLSSCVCSSYCLLLSLAAFGNSTFDSMPGQVEWPELTSVQEMELWAVPLATFFLFCVLSYLIPERRFGKAPKDVKKDPESGNAIPDENTALLVPKDVRTSGGLCSFSCIVLCCLLLAGTLLVLHTYTCSCVFSLLLLLLLLHYSGRRQDLPARRVRRRLQRTLD